MLAAWSFLAMLAALGSMTSTSTLGRGGMSAYKEWNINGHTVRLPSEATWAPPNPPPPPSPPLPTEQRFERAECDRWAQAGECAKNPAFMNSACSASCEAFGPKDTYESPSSCVSWANSGECEANPAFMFESCAASCAAVGARRKAYAERCPINGTDALKPGDVIPMFERAVSNFPELDPTLLSPSPPIALFENFASEEEIQALIRAGQGRYKRSQVLDTDTLGPATNIIRTSSNTWCDTPECLDNEHVRAVTERVAAVTGVPHENSEFAQLLEYRACAGEDSEDCQYYRRHHDYIDADRDRQQGVRILTVFIYLSNVTKGGETAFFTEPGLSVTPKAGRAVMWSQVLDQDPHTKDPRTEHEARPVLEGTKLAANFWIHQRDFKSAHARGCTQS
uniref:Fe2OG dioxygenase domain-containing protein n=1 Tax=Strombidinopsis acuminata TaxID=141414 RepID=A0A7S3TYV7_9SPIT